MIVYLTVRYSETFQAYLATRGGGIRERFRIVPYHALGQARALPRATYIFADVERLMPAQASVIEQVYLQLAAVDPPVRILNHPTRSLSRYPLLRALRAQGVNTFTAYRADEDLSAVRFPVFVRGADDHIGPRTELIDNAGELEAVLAHALLHGFEPEDVLVVEYEEARSPDGFFRKYGVVRVGDTLIPRHVWFGERWALKYGERMIDPDKVEEERAFLDSTDHNAELLDIFNTARVEFGRIDYAVVDGRITVWEINTNPSLFPSDPSTQLPERVPFDDLFDRRLRKAWDAIDAPDEEAPAIPYTLHRPRAHREAEAR